MRVRSLTTLAGILLVAGAARAVHAQSLADVAKKEADRRKTVKGPAKVYTDKDLKPAPPPSTPSTASPVAEASAKTADQAGDKEKKDQKTNKEDATAEAQKTADYWRKRMTTLQTQLDRDQTYLDAVQSRINALTAEFVNRDDPAQRAVIERERTRNLAELDRLRKAIETDRKAISDFEDEARRAGVPPGWLR